MCIPGSSSSRCSGCVRFSCCVTAPMRCTVYPIFQDTYRSIAISPNACGRGEREAAPFLIAEDPERRSASGKEPLSPGKGSLPFFSQLRMREAAVKQDKEMRLSGPRGVMCTSVSISKRDWTCCKPPRPTLALNMASAAPPAASREP